MSFFHALSIAIGSIIGWGCFVLPGNSYLPSAGITGTIIALLISFILMCIISLIYLKIDCNSLNDNFIIKCNSLFLYMCLMALNLTSLNLVITYFIPIDVTNYTPSILCMVVIVLINRQNNKQSGLFQIICVLMLIIPIIGLFLLFMTNVQPVLTQTPTTNSSIFGIVLTLPWMYVGFDTIFTLNLKKNVYKIVVWSILISTLLYIMCAIMSIPYGNSINSIAMVDTLTLKLGSWSGVLVLISCFMAILSGINGFFVSCNNLLGKKFNLGICIVSILLTFLGRESLNYLVDMTSVIICYNFIHVARISIKNSNKLIRIASLITIILSVLFIVLYVVPISKFFFGYKCFIALIIYISILFTIKLRRELFMKKTAVVLYSGGIDSTTCLAMAIDKYGVENVLALSMSYGQKHDKEVECAKQIVEHYGVDHITRDLSSIMEFSNCSLLKHSTEELKHETYSKQLEKIGGEGTVDSYVPFRNGLMISCASAIALSVGANVIYYGAHADDSAGRAYPDCTPEFWTAMNMAIFEGSGRILKLEAPLLMWNKGQVVGEGLRLNAPYNLSWSCYEGKDKPCGTCATCVDRKQAFIDNGTVDPVEYM